MITHTDTSLNRQLFPEADHTIKNLGDLAASAKTDLDVINLKYLSNPHIQSIVVHADGSVTNLDSFLGHANNIGETADKEVQKWAKPKGILKEGLNLTYDFLKQNLMNRLTLLFPW